MSEYRTGNDWGVTIVREGTQPPDADGKRPDDRMVAVVMNGAVVTGDRELAERVCRLLTADDSPVAEPDTREVIAAVGHRAANARLELGALPYANCPGPHRWVPHTDMSARWCRACGYAEGGRRMEERP